MTTTAAPQGGARASDSPALETMMRDLRATYAAGRTRSLEWRLRQLEGIERLVEECEPEIAEALASDLGRPAVEAWLGDLASTAAEAAFARRHLRRWMRPRRVLLPATQLPGWGKVEFEPRGVVLVIGPWNYPVYLCLSPLVAAVAAGNCAVVKPSELAPATSALLARLIPQYLDPEAVKVVEGDATVTQGLLAQGFDHALFTGGTEIGRKIMEGASRTLTPVTLELGGKSPVIVTHDADLDIAARRIAWVKLMNSGQTCIAPDYVLADRRIAAELTAKIVACLGEFRADQPAAGQRIVNERQLDRLAGYLEATHGEVVTGGRVDREALTIEPTVILDPDPAEPAMVDEIFGPILPVVPFDSVDEVVRFVNGRPRPLALYLFTTDRALRQRIVRVVPAGGVVVNHVALHCLIPQLPFGGVGASGMGAYHGRWGFEELSHRKAVLVKTQRPDLRLIYPPYSERAMKIMRKLF
jgi:aldehyde dehydrogenase (NAD+)